MRSFAMFPGQGSQFSGMGKDWFDQFKEAKLVFEECSDAISVDLKKLCFEGSSEELAMTENTQPSILVVSAAIWKSIQARMDFKPDYFAGHSLGEYSALVASGKLTAGDAVKLVRHRGKSMQEAVPAGVGAMAALMKFKDLAEIEAICNGLSGEGGVVSIANYNSDAQVVIAGHAELVDKALAKFKELRVIGKKLNVSAPFHCELMRPAQKAMKPLLDETSLHSNSHVVIPNISGEDTGSDYQIDFLLQQIVSPVKWTQTLSTIESKQTELFLEVGPGNVLCGLAKRSLKNTDGIKLCDSSDPAQLFEVLESQS